MRSCICTYIHCWCAYTRCTPTHLPTVLTVATHTCSHSAIWSQLHISHCNQPVIAVLEWQSLTCYCNSHLTLLFQCCITKIMKGLYLTLKWKCVWWQQKTIQVSEYTRHLVVLYGCSLSQCWSVLWPHAGCAECGWVDGTVQSQPHYQRWCPTICGGHLDRAIHRRLLLWGSVITPTSVYTYICTYMCNMLCARLLKQLLLCVVFLCAHVQYIVM